MPAFDRRTVMLGAAVSVLFSGSSHAAPPKKDTGYYVIAEINAKAGSESALRDLLVPFAKSSRKEPGCLIYTLMEVISDKEVNVGVWDFGVHPVAPENRDVMKPQPKRPVTLERRRPN